MDKIGSILITIPFAALALAGLLFLGIALFLKVAMREVKGKNCNCRHHDRGL